MGRTTSVTLGQHFEGFIEQLIDQGHYQSTSEVIRDALRKLEKEHKLEAIMDKLDDFELARIVEERRTQEEIPVDFDDL